MTLAAFTLFFLMSLRDVVDRIPRLLILPNVRKTSCFPELVMEFVTSMPMVQILLIWLKVAVRGTL